ncbi:hypothetical protein F5Y08DRAFT_334049 [Xylaria arbuscula]|nr:hypothetical protein F5Y08DRAFT_334049 [Xylaria arbuscula]
MGYDFECGICHKVFETGRQACDNYPRSTGHRAPAFECDNCACYFGSETARFQHMKALNHFQWECSICDETTMTINYCSKCQKTFTNYNNLKMHLNSRTHRNYQIQCPFCKKSHATATGLTHHVESGSCPNAAGLTRDVLYKFIRNKDPAGSITNNLIGWSGSTQYEANWRSYNAEYQEHLYHCPNQTCKREFTTLAGFVNHLESESCGYIRFSKVQRRIQNVVGGDKLITF